MKKWHIVILSILLISTLFYVGCSGTKKVKDGDTVKVNYILTLEDGTVYDSSNEGEPFEFTLGETSLIKGFEDAVIGMEVGETKTVTITPENAYGSYYEELVQEVDRSELPEDLEPVVGQQLQGQAADGTVHIFTITNVTDTTVTLDGNHPLADETLTFEITLVEISEGE